MYIYYIIYLYVCILYTYINTLHTYEKWTKPDPDAGWLSQQPVITHVQQLGHVHILYMSRILPRDLSPISLATAVTSYGHGSSIHQQKWGMTQLFALAEQRPLLFNHGKENNPSGIVRNTILDSLATQLWKKAMIPCHHHLHLICHVKLPQTSGH